jgi:hypothetical protein
MSGRPRNARGLTGRDAAKENDVEADLLSRAIEAIRKAKEYSDASDKTGQAIIELELEIKATGEVKGTKRGSACRRASPKLTRDRWDSRATREA